MIQSVFFASILLAVTAMAAVLSYALSIASTRWAFRLGARDEPRLESRKIHSKTMPLFGGVGIGLTILASVIILHANGFLPGISLLQLFGFGAAVVMLILGGMTDDMKPRPPWIQFIFPATAAILVFITGTGIVQVTNPLGDGALPFPDWLTAATTVAWLLFATYATKLLDGLDGLVTGIAVIGSGMIGALTAGPAYFQPGVAMLSAAVGGAFLGFLPRNVHPARQFLGESGSTLAGFTLGFLAIVSSAKVAVALAVLAIPLADAMRVVAGRMWRGASFWSGDDTHLHFRLLKAGLPHRTAVFLLWGFSFAAGAIALSLQTRGKIFLVASLVVLTALSSWAASRKSSP